MDKREAEDAVDIFGQEIKPGTIIMYPGAGALLQVACVKNIKRSGSGRLIGYHVEYPHHSLSILPGQDLIKKKLIRASRELACVPASKLGRLASTQARYTDSFSMRLQYMAEKIQDA